MQLLLFFFLRRDHELGLAALLLFLHIIEVRFLHFLTFLDLDFAFNHFVPGIA